MIFGRLFSTCNFLVPVIIISASIEWPHQVLCSVLQTTMLRVKSTGLRIFSIAAAFFLPMIVSSICRCVLSFFSSAANVSSDYPHLFVVVITYEAATGNCLIAAVEGMWSSCWCGRRLGAKETVTCQSLV